MPTDTQQAFYEALACEKCLFCGGTREQVNYETQQREECPVCKVTGLRYPMLSKECPCSLPGPRCCNSCNVLGTWLNGQHRVDCDCHGSGRIALPPTLELLFSILLQHGHFIYSATTGVYFVRPVMKSMAEILRLCGQGNTVLDATFDALMKARGAT